MAQPIHVWRRLTFAVMAFVVLIGSSQISAASPPASLPGIMAPAGSETAYAFDGQFTVDTNLRSASGLSAWAIDAWEVTNNIPLPPLGAAFMAAERKYGVNARYLVAHMVLETGWGASYLAQTKKNLFGYNAADRNPIGLATAFPDYASGIDTVAGFIANEYLDPAGRWWGGARTLRGMHRYYATGLYWADSVAQIANGLALPTLSAHHFAFALSAPTPSGAGASVKASLQWTSDGFALPAGVSFVARWRPLAAAGADPAGLVGPLTTPAFSPATEVNRGHNGTTLTLAAPIKAGDYALEVAVVDSDGAPLPDGSSLPITPVRVRVAGPDALAYAATGTSDGNITLTMTNIGSAPLVGPPSTPAPSLPAPKSPASPPVAAVAGDLQAWLAPLAGGDPTLLESVSINAPLNSGAAVTLTLTPPDLAAVSKVTPALLLVRFAPSAGSLSYADSPPGVFRIEHFTLAPGATPPPTPSPSPLPAPVVTPAPLPTFVPPFSPGPTVPPTPGPSPAPGHTLTPTPPAPSPSPTPGSSPSPSNTPIVTPSPTDTPIVTPAPTDTPIVTPAPTDTPIVTPTPTDTPVATPLPTDTPIVTPPPTPDPTAAPTPDPTPDPTIAPTDTPIDTPSPDPSLSALLTEVRAELAMYTVGQGQTMTLAAAPLVGAKPKVAPSASTSPDPSKAPLFADPSSAPASQSLFMVTSLFVADPSGEQPLPSPTPSPTPALTPLPSGLPALAPSTSPSPLPSAAPSPLVVVASGDPLNPVDQTQPGTLLPTPAPSPSLTPSASPAPSPSLTPLASPTPSFVPLAYGFSSALDYTSGNGVIELVNQGTSTITALIPSIGPDLASSSPSPSAIPTPSPSPASSVAGARLEVTAIPVAGDPAKAFSFSLALPSDIPAGSHADFPFALPAATAGRTSWLLVVHFVPAGVTDLTNLPCYLLWALGPAPASAAPSPTPALITKL